MCVFFTFDHIDYTRCVPIHFRKIKYTIDTGLLLGELAHKQNNVMMKGACGAVWLTENPAAFRKWMIAGTEQAQLMKEFVTKLLTRCPRETLPHEEGFSTQKAFKQQVLFLIQTINHRGNQFLENTDQLLNLNMQNVMDESVIETVRSVKLLDKDQYRNNQKISNFGLYLYHSQPY